jgi:hypothetical protein
VVTTAPATPQVEAILWRYMGNAHKKADLPRRISLSARARGVARVDVESHAGGSITGDLMTKAW